MLSEQRAPVVNGKGENTGEDSQIFSILDGFECQLPVRGKCCGSQ